MFSCGGVSTIEGARVNSPFFRLFSSFFRLFFEVGARARHPAVVF